jgi:peptide/nickel transport system permease protein
MIRRFPPCQRARRAAGALASLLLTLFGLLLFTFLLAHLAPIDPALQVVGDHASEASYAAARHGLGLDQSLPRQFVHYVWRLMHGDLGISRSTGQPVASDLLQAFPATLELATVAMLGGGLGGLGLALLAARHPGGWSDRLARVIAIFGYSVPIFWLGLIGLLLFYARWHWAAGPGRVDDIFLYTRPAGSGLLLFDSLRAGDGELLRNVIAHLWLPATVLALNSLAGVARVMRAALLEELHKEYVTGARARGSGEWRIVCRHVLPNTAGMLVTVLALSYASLLEGAVLTETVFAWPGIGRYLTTALFAADTPAILGATLVIGLCFVLLNMLADVLARLLDPRTR